LKGFRFHSEIPSFKFQASKAKMINRIWFDGFSPLGEMSEGQRGY